MGPRERYSFCQFRVRNDSLSVSHICIKKVNIDTCCRTGGHYEFRRSGPGTFVFAKRAVKCRPKTFGGPIVSEDTVTQTCGYDGALYGLYTITRSTHLIQIVEAGLLSFCTIVIAVEMDWIENRKLPQIKDHSLKGQIKNVTLTFSH